MDWKNEILCCPNCKGDLSFLKNGARCKKSKSYFESKDGILNFLPKEV